MDDNSLSILISDFIQTTPEEITEELLHMLGRLEGIPSDFQRVKFLSTVQNPTVRGKLKKLLEYWEKE